MAGGGTEAIPLPKILQIARNVLEVCGYEDLLAFRSEFHLKKADQKNDVQMIKVIRISMNNYRRVKKR